MMRQEGSGIERQTIRTVRPNRASFDGKRKGPYRIQERVRSDDSLFTVGQVVEVAAAKNVLKNE
jgi:hypothetical protein